MHLFSVSQAPAGTSHAPFRGGVRGVISQRLVQVTAAVSSGPGAIWRPFYISPWWETVAEWVHKHVRLLRFKPELKVRKEFTTIYSFFKRKIAKESLLSP